VVSKACIHTNLGVVTPERSHQVSVLSTPHHESKDKNEAHHSNIMVKQKKKLAGNELFMNFGTKENEIEFPNDDVFGGRG
jgi:hypothetical protein